MINNKIFVIEPLFSNNKILKHELIKHFNNVDFNYKKISDLRGAVDTKINYCVINETDGTPVKLETSIEFIEDATCFHTFFTSADGIPHKYIVGLVKVKLMKTGEEVWTWSKAVQIQK